VFVDRRRQRPNRVQHTTDGNTEIRRETAKHDFLFLTIIINLTL